MKTRPVPPSQIKFGDNIIHGGVKYRVIDVRRYFSGLGYWLNVSSEAFPGHTLDLILNESEKVDKVI